MNNNNRLGILHQQFTRKYGFKTTYDNDNQEAEVELDCGNRTVKATYVFDSSEDSYEFGSVIRTVKQDERSKISSEIMSSEPIKGITERIANGKLVVMGGREGLLHAPDEVMELFFRQDTANIGEAVSRYSDHKRKKR
jgi:hypothetical protein